MYNEFINKIKHQTEEAKKLAEANKEEAEKAHYNSKEFQDILAEIDKASKQGNDMLTSFDSKITVEDLELLRDIGFNVNWTRNRSNGKFTKIHVGWWN